MKKYDSHPIADIFPLMSEHELSELTQDIREHGLREPIWLHPDGRILDGRNRYNACCQIGIEPTTETYGGDNPVAFSISLNLHRRHLNESQRAMVAARLKPMFEEEAKARQLAAQNNDTGKAVSANLREQSSGKASDYAAEMVKQHLESIDWEERRNRDQETSFVSFDTRSFPTTPPILVASGGCDGKAMYTDISQEVRHA